MTLFNIWNMFYSNSVLIMKAFPLNCSFYFFSQKIFKHKVIFHSYKIEETFHCQTADLTRLMHYFMWTVHTGCSVYVPDYKTKSSEHQKDGSSFPYMQCILITYLFSNKIIKYMFSFFPQYFCFYRLFNVHGGIKGTWKGQGLNAKVSRHIFSAVQNLVIFLGFGTFYKFFFWTAKS